MVEGLGPKCRVWAEQRLALVRILLGCAKNPFLLTSPEGPYTLFMELGPKKTIPVLVLGT